LLCALTDFEALCGVRPIEETAVLLEDLGLQRFADAFGRAGPTSTIEALLRHRVDAAPIVEACRESRRPEARWVVELAALHPGDPSVAATLLLNYVHLLPGEALQLGPGNLHAYLAGAGIELMGASDNVVRAGLTSKPVDVDTLLEVMDATPLLDPVMSPARVYPLSGTSIRLLRLVGPAQRRAKTHELFVGSSGTTGYLAPGAALDVPAGDTVFVATA
jgi:mannose-6-phosphate isomerase